MIYDAAGVKRLLSRWDYPDGEVETYGRAMEAAARHKGASAALESVSAAYAGSRELDIRAVLEQMDSFASVCGESRYTVRMLPYLCMLESAESKYAAAGIGEDVYRDSFADLLWKTLECRTVYGVWGSFVAPWFYRFFELKCFALGRLQFEFAAFGEDAPLTRGERVINVHIPSSGPLYGWECEESYARAVDFFGCAA